MFAHDLSIVSTDLRISVKPELLARRGSYRAVAAPTQG